MSKYIFENGFSGEELEDAVLRKIWTWSETNEESAEISVGVTIEERQFFYMRGIGTMSRIVKTQYPKAGTLKGFQLNHIRFKEDVCEVSGISLTFNLFA